MRFCPSTLFAIDPPLLPGTAASPPPAQKPALQHPLAVLLSLCLGLFGADAVVSLLDDTAGLLLNTDPLAALRGIIGFFALFIAFVVYVLMGFTPTIPKRLFLPITLFTPITVLATIPCWIYYYSRAAQLAWLTSFLQVILFAGVL